MEQKYYKVFWSKDVKKKKKVYNQGVIIMTNNKVKLYGSQSQLLCESNIKNVFYHNPDNQQQFIINNNFYISLDFPIKKQQFTTGSIFLPRSDYKKKEKKNIKSQNQINQGLNLFQKYYIEPFLLPVLRPHQLQGIKFMLQCIVGIKGKQITGCILADYMGLGKTLQTLSLLYILLKHNKQNIYKKAIVVSPLTLVGVWQKQVKKWFFNKLIPIVAKGDGKQINSICKYFSKQNHRLLLISYQSFTSNIQTLNNHCDIIVFDQGHRLKNNKNKLHKKISNFSCKKRILISGTPLQNSIQQFYTCIKLVNPFLFPSETLFKNIFQKPILDGMKKNATEQQIKFAFQRSKQLSNRVKQFSLRRRADVLQQLLPQKKQYHVFLKMTTIQYLWYNRLLEIYRKQNNNQVLSFMNKMRKLFTHPKLFKLQKIQQLDFSSFSESLQNQKSNKINFVLNVVKNAINNHQKVVIVSYFTQTLTFIEQILNNQLVGNVRLDGSMNSQKRQQKIERFQQDKQIIVFLLSAKAGGTGLNLTCANKMILIQPDWNPSNDNQVMGRIWRDGQTKIAHIYRLIMISTFEQKILQRQYMKQSLSQKLIDESKINKLFDLVSLKNLFIDNEGNCLTYLKQENSIQEVKRWNNDFKNNQNIQFVYLKKLKNNLMGVNEFDDEGIFLNNEVDDKQAQLESQTECERQQEQVKSNDIKGIKIMIQRKQEKKQGYEQVVYNNDEIEQEYSLLRKGQKMDLVIRGKNKILQKIKINRNKQELNNV